MAIVIMSAGYPNEAAVHVALGTIRQRLEKLKQENKVQHTVTTQCIFTVSE